MSKVAFGKSTAPASASQPATTPVVDAEVVNDGPAVPATPATPSATPVTAVATVPPSAPPSTTPANRFSDSADDIDFSQLSLPTLKIVQSIGDLAQIFDPGALVIQSTGGQAAVVAEAPPKAGKVGAPGQVPANVVVLAVSRTDRYTEKTDGGARGRLFNTEREVYDAGGTTNWDESKASGKPLFQALASVLLLIQKPDHTTNESGLFGIEADGKQYALVVWHAKSSAMTNGIKPLRTARRLGYLKAGYPTRQIKFNTVFRQYQGSNTAFIPSLTPGEATSPALRQAGREILGQ